MADYSRPLEEGYQSQCLHCGKKLAKYPQRNGFQSEWHHKKGPKECSDWQGEKTLPTPTEIITKWV